ncbi:3-oxoacyl-reductase [Hypoxylon cercidicola]|nr:3-oxoacyl-reductase [Hypoxylon cercidicola]
MSLLWVLSRLGFLSAMMGRFGQRTTSFSQFQCLRFVRSQVFDAGSSIPRLGGWGVRASYSSLAREQNHGRSVIVTGSGRGIGKGIALRLAADGYNVCVNDIGTNKASCDEVVREIQGMGRKACTAIADVTKRDQVKQMIQTSVENLGPLNTLIANAGVVQVKPVLELTEKDFESVFAVNVFGVHNCLAEAASQMIRQGNCQPDSPGKLIAAASIVAFRPFLHLPAYSVSKWAVRGLAQVYAMELAKHHITVNSYAPGIIGTAMWEKIDAGIGGMTGMAKGEVMNNMVMGDTVLKKTGNANDVARLVSFLASSDSNYVTGQTQIVDGGSVFT